MTRHSKTHIKTQTRRKRRPRPQVIGNWGSHSDNTTTEIKFNDVVVAQSACADTGTVVLLNGTAQGLDALGDRVGRKIMMKRLRYHGSVSCTVANLTSGTGYAGNSNVIRVLLVYDRQTGGAAPTWGNIITTSGGFNAPLGMYDVSNLDRFEILSDRMIPLCEAGPNIGMFSLDVVVHLETRYNAGSTGTVSDIVSGGLFMAFADSNVNGTATTLLSFVSRVEFTDP